MTGQHRETMECLVSDFYIRSSIEWLYDGPEVSAVSQTVKWGMAVAPRLRRRLAELMREEGRRRTAVIVHGDTLSTLLGAVAARSLGLVVAHVESGLRSNNIWHPFPEEMTRRAVFRLTDIAFCPGSWAFDNMLKYSVERVDTGANTLRDALDFATSKVDGIGTNEHYSVCSIHRFENIFNGERLKTIVRLIGRAAEVCPLIFVLHPATRKRLEKYGLLDTMAANPRIRLVARMGYVEFIGLVRDARFVITDGGGNQEELSYLGVPTLLMRKASERPEGLGSGIVLCHYAEGILERFLATLAPKGDRAAGPNVSPSALIADRLQIFG